MASLVADYSSSSNSSCVSNSTTDSDSSDDANADKIPEEPTTASRGDDMAVLENPFRLFRNGRDQRETNPKTRILPAASVFSNPYKEEENAKQSILETHVKLTPNPSESEGRQVCWNYRKGRCRFGRNCKFSHDSDLALTTANNNNNNSRHNADNHQSALTTKKTTAVETAEQKPCKKNKKRPGLSQTLVPSKKVMKAYYRQKKEQ